MGEYPLDTLREAQEWLRNWLRKIQTLADPASECKDDFVEIAKRVAAVDRAIREATLDLTRSDEWRQEISLYTAALREVRVKLDSFETTLRIRRAQLGQNRARLNAVNAWASLAREIG
jgi:uncharacterized coiled-coil DUF342 family protein